MKIGLLNRAAVLFYLLLAACISPDFDSNQARNTIRPGGGTARTVQSERVKINKEIDVQNATGSGATAKDQIVRNFENGIPDLDWFTGRGSVVTLKVEESEDSVGRYTFVIHQATFGNHSVLPDDNPVRISTSNNCDRICARLEAFKKLAPVVAKLPEGMRVL